MMLTRVDHIGIASNDLEAAITFYSEMLDLPAGQIGDGEFAGVEIPVGRPLSACEALVKAKRKASSTWPSRTMVRLSPDGWTQPRITGYESLSFHPMETPQPFRTTSSASITSSSRRATAPAARRISAITSASRSSAR